MARFFLRACFLHNYWDTTNFIGSEQKRCMPNRLSASRAPNGSLSSRTWLPLTIVSSVAVPWRIPWEIWLGLQTAYDPLKTGSRQICVERFATTGIDRGASNDWRKRFHSTRRRAGDPRDWHRTALPPALPILKLLHPTNPSTQLRYQLATIWHLIERYQV